MELNARIVTEKLAETKAFFTSVLGFEVNFENDFRDAPWSDRYFAI